MARTFREMLPGWQDGEAGFYNWLSDIEPKILVRNNRYEPFTPTPKQRAFIRQVLKVDKAGRFVHSLSLNIQPRRHGKSTAFALIVLWLFTSRRNFTIQLLGSSEDHCRRVQFATLKKIIAASPRLSKLIPPANQFSWTIVFPELSNQIQFSASNLSTSFGDRLNLLWVSDLHSFVDFGPFNALQASLLDSQDSMVFIDSNADNVDGPVHSIQKEAATDPSIYSNYTSYRDFEHFKKEAPSWIDRAKAARLEKTTLPADFKRDILGQRSDAKNALFSTELIEQARDKYKVPVTDIATLTQGRAYKVGGGLDRARSLIAGPRGDSTVWTTIIKVAGKVGSEPEYYILNQVSFLVNSAAAIKSVILEDHKQYKLDNLIFEATETADLYTWALEKQIPCELISPHSTNQNASFPMLYQSFKEGRFHFSEDLTDFASELSTFTYQRLANGGHSFGHSQQKFHDDTVFSVNWAMFSLRSHILNLFELSGIQCANRSPRRPLCFLFGGSADFREGCGRRCEAYSEVHDMYRQFKSFQTESEMTLPGFHQAYVKVTGAVLYQNV